MTMQAFLELQESDQERLVVRATNSVIGNPHCKALVTSFSLYATVPNCTFI